MRSNWYKFEDVTSTGLDKLPLNSNIYILDSDGNSNPYMICITDISSITGTTTVQDVLNNTDWWFEVGPNRHGSVSEAELAIYTPDLLKNDSFEYELNQTTVIANPLNAQPGDTGTITIKQDLLGSRACTFGDAYVFPGGDATLVTGVYESNILSYTISETGSVVVEYSLTLTGSDIDGGYEHIFTWDSMIAESDVTMNVDMEYSTNGGISFITLTAGINVVMATGTGPYILATNNPLTEINIGTLLFGKLSGNFTGISKGGLVNINNLVHLEEFLTNVNVSGINASSISSMYLAFSRLSLITIPPDVSSWDTSLLSNIRNAFEFMSTVTTPPDVSNWDVSNCYSLEGTFSNMTNCLTPPDISNWDTSGCNNTEIVFSGMRSCITPPDVSNWDMSGVTTLGSMFQDMQGLLIPPDVSKWDTSSCTLFYRVLRGLSSCEIAPDVSNWDVSEGILLHDMFYDNTVMKEYPDTSNWNLTSNATNISRIFSEMYAADSIQYVSDWDVINVTAMNGVFERNNAATNTPDVSLWDTSSATTMESLFYELVSITTPPDVSLWDVSSVTNMTNMFRDLSSVTSFPDVSNWNTSLVESMSFMFYSINEPVDGIDASAIVNFNISSLTTADGMFAQTKITTTSYDAILVSWAAQIPNVQPGVNIEFGDSKYTFAGIAEAGRNALLAEGWVIGDAGWIGTNRNNYDTTTTQPVDPGWGHGDYYVQITTNGNIDASWGTIGGTAIAIGEKLVYNGTTTEWEIRS